MITIRISNSYSKIEGLGPTQTQQLRKLLSYKIDANAAFFSKNRFSRDRFCIDLKGNFPSGLLSRVETWLKQKQLAYTIVNTRQVPKRCQSFGHLSTPVPYAAQLAAVASAARA